MCLANILYVRVLYDVDQRKKRGEESLGINRIHQSTVEYNTGILARKIYN